MARFCSDTTEFKGGSDECTRCVISCLRVILKRPKAPFLKWVPGVLEITIAVPGNVKVRGSFVRWMAASLLGQAGEIERVDEFRVELVCKDDLIQAALRALKQAHPYEEPAYEVFRMEAL